MSDNARHRIKLVLFVAVIGLFTFFGYHDGKRSADRYYATHPYREPFSTKRVSDCVEEALAMKATCDYRDQWHPVITLPGERLEVTPMALAGIGKPQAPALEETKPFDHDMAIIRETIQWLGKCGDPQTYWERDCKSWSDRIDAHDRNAQYAKPDLSAPAAAHPLKRPKTWPPDCKLPSCAPVSTEPLRWADGTCTDFFTQETIPCPLKLGKPPCCSAVFETIPERLCESPKGCTELPKDMAFFSILESDDVYDGKSDKFYARCSVKNHVSAYCESIKPPEGEAVDFRTGKLGKRKPQETCYPTDGIKVVESCFEMRSN